jgi:hypothetical protein
MSNLQVINDTTKAYVMGPSLYNTNFPGETLGGITDTGLDECKQLCLDNAQCLYSIYNTSDRNCQILGARSDDGRISGIKSIDTYDLFPKTDLTGSPLGNDYLSIPLSECETKCSNDVNCEAFSYGNGFCSLKKLDIKPGTVTSFKAIQKTSPITDPDMLLKFNCCMNKVSDQECSVNGNLLLPYSVQCDNTMMEICNAYPYLDECGCINRDKNFQYQKVKQTLSKYAESGNLKDECWYPSCQDDSGDYIPTTMIPISIQYYNGNEVVKINDVKCVSDTSRCTFKDIYNPQFNSTECTGLMNNNNNGNNGVISQLMNTIGLKSTDVNTNTNKESFDMLEYPVRAQDFPLWPNYYSAPYPSGYEGPYDFVPLKTSLQNDHHHHNKGWMNSNGSAYREFMNNNTNYQDDSNIKPVENYNDIYWFIIIVIVIIAFVYYYQNKKMI